MGGLAGDLAQIKSVLSTGCTPDDCGPPAYDTSGQTSTVSRLALLRDSELGKEERRALLDACWSAAWACLDKEFLPDPDMAGFIDPPRIIQREGAYTICAYESVAPRVVDSFVDHFWGNLQRAGITGRLEAMEAQPAPLQMSFPRFYHADSSWIMALVALPRFPNHTLNRAIPLEVRDLFAHWWAKHVRGEWLADASGLPRWLESEGLTTERAELEKQGEANVAHLGLRRGDDRPVAWLDHAGLQGVGYLDSPADDAHQLAQDFVPLLARAAEHGLTGSVFPSEDYCTTHSVPIELPPVLTSRVHTELASRYPGPIMIGPNRAMSGLVTVARSHGFTVSHPTPDTTCLEYERLETWIREGQL